MDPDGQLGFRVSSCLLLSLRSSFELNELSLWLWSW